MSREDWLYVILIAGVVVEWKVAFMSNTSWEVCFAVASVCILLLVFARRLNKNTSP